MKITENEVEELALDILKDDLGYKILNGLEISPGGSKQERDDFREVVLKKRLLAALEKLNPEIPKDALEEAAKKTLRVSNPNQLQDNEQFHKLLTEGVPVSYRKGSEIKNDTANLVDFERPEKNEFLAVNQFTIIEDKYNRRPDVILFVNGLPLVVFELKNLAKEKATIDDAFTQLQNYKTQIPSLFRFNEILVISDGTLAAAGTLSSSRDWFMAWKTIDDKIPKSKLSLEVLLKGMCNKKILLDLIQNFIVFEKDKETIKKIAAYHQYNAVNKAVESTVKATKGNKKAGVVWHTQGSGKSLSMVFYSGKLAVEKELENPTIVVLTDRNDLDDQLFKTFSRCSGVLRQPPENAESRAHIKELLKKSSGGIVFTTIQKFSPDKAEEFPRLSDRKNIIVIADEAHRTQYGFSAHIVETKDKQAFIKYGFAKYLRDALPNASFIGFTGTPIEKQDKSTPAVFGNYVDKYDIQQAVDDRATVRLMYESRLAKLGIKPEERRKIDPEVESITEGQEDSVKNKLKSKWARLEKIVGSPERLKRIAKDIVEHFEERLKVLDGKAMIVCMSRRICVELYNEIVALKPEWHNSDDKEGIIKVIMTGSSSDKEYMQEHVRNKKRREDIGDRFKNPKTELRIVLVRDMWLTGFDAPSVHTMYIDKPMKSHGLMQTIARANRKYKDKDAGLIVDYFGIGKELKDAVMQYTSSGGKGEVYVDQSEAVKKMLEKHEVVKDMFHGFNYKKFFELSPKERLSVIPNAVEHILKGKDKLKERYVKETSSLVRAFSLSVPNEKAMKIKDEVGFFQAIRSTIVKNTTVSVKDSIEFDSAIKQIISKAVISDRIVDIFEAAGVQKPDISILSDKFLLEVKDIPQKNLAFEALKKLLNDDIKIRFKKNVVQEKSFMEMLEKTILKYTNKSIEAAQAIEELIELAKKIREEQNKGNELGLNDDEKAFYDALADCKEAINVLGDEKLRIIALELVNMIRNSVKIDWTVRESVQADLRLRVKKILKKYGYPPSGQEHAAELVLTQARKVAEDWAEK